MAIVIKEIYVKTRVEKTVYKQENIPLEVLEKLKYEILAEIVKAERKKSALRLKPER